MNTYNISDHKLIVPIGRDPFSMKRGLLPLDITRSIFEILYLDLPDLALVCKNWKRLTNDEVLREKIFPPTAFGAKAWKQYIGADAGKEPRLPRRAYRDIAENVGMITFVPDIVKINNKKIKLNSLNKIFDLIKKPTTDLDAGFCLDWVWPEASKEKRKTEKPHWVWIKDEVLGKDVHLTKASKAKISRLMDTAISMFMEYARTKKRYFIWDKELNTYTLLNVKEKTNHCRLSIGFSRSGLIVTYKSSPEYIGYVIAKRAF